MNALLSPHDRRRLIGVLGRLASDHDGERAAAGLLATCILQTHGLAWEQIVGPVGGGLVSRDPTPPAGHDGRGWRAAAAECRKHPALLSDRETDFLESLTRWSGALTPKQAAWLERIAARVTAPQDVR